MRERLTQVGGKLEIESDGNGTIVRAILPAESGEAKISASLL
jgi:signal transduction histidine kinase